MKSKLLRGILTALMLVSAVACTDGGGGTETVPDTDADTVVTLPATETPTLSETEPETDPEPETEPPIEIEIPAYEDIGLKDNLEGADERVSLDYQFDGMAESLSQIKTDSALVFTTNGVITKDDRGITATDQVWNAVGFGASPTGAYTAEATLYHHGDSTSITTRSCTVSASRPPRTCSSTAASGSRSITGTPIWSSIRCCPSSWRTPPP